MIDILKPRGHGNVSWKFQPGGLRAVVGAALIVILWLRAGDVDTILARLDSDNREVTRLIGLNLGNLTSAFPLLQVPRRMLHSPDGI